MQDEQRPESARSGPVFPEFSLTGLVAAAPLVLAYAVLPLLGMAGRMGLLPAPGPDMSLAWPWLVLTGGGLLAALLTGPGRRPGQRPVRALMGLLAGGVLALAGLLLTIPQVQGPFFPAERLVLSALPEAAPLAYLLLAGLWASTFGAPGAEWFRRLGALLGGLVLLDVLVVSLGAGLPLPGGLLLDAAGRDVRAFLLGAALLLALDDERTTGAYPDWMQVLVMIGLLGCGSPSAMVAAGAAYLFLGRQRIEARIGFALACAGGVMAPLRSDMLALMDSRVQIYMTWLAGLEVFHADPWILLTGLGPGPLDLQLPEATAILLGMLDMRFTLPPHAVPAFWMRLALVWGALPPLIFLGLGVGITALARGRAVAGLMTLAMGMGLVFPLLYNGSVALVFCLALACALARRRDESPKAEQDLPAAP